ncbi:hypothetical protein C8R42DRAFT_723673 [Lentinula raphanica]|nr:hypothetical protein C8R42DRAFT_723673 [Lentinula raphanica]
MTSQNRSRRTKLKRIDSESESEEQALPDMAIDTDNTISAFTSHGKGKGKSHDVPLDEGEFDDDYAQTVAGSIFIPSDINPGDPSELSTKRKYQKGATALRRPSHFYAARSHVSRTMNNVVNRLPLGQGFKPPVQHVNARIITDRQPSEDLDEIFYAEPYNRYSADHQLFQDEPPSSSHTDDALSNPLLWLIPPANEDQDQDRLNDGSSSIPQEFSSLLDQDHLLGLSTFSDLTIDSSSMILTADSANYIDDILQDSDSKNPQQSPTQESVPESPPRTLNLDKNIDNWLKSNSDKPSHFFNPLEAEGKARIEINELRTSLEMHSEANLLAADVIFVHHDHISELAFRSRRLRTNKLKPVFIGHSKDSNEVWNVEEVYPYGGIVTFTAQALAHSVDLLMHKIREIAMHPLWKVFLVPSVLGLAIKNYYGDIKVWQRLNADFAFDELLEMIDDETVNVMSDPSAPDPHWDLQQKILRVLTHEEMVKMCVDAAPARGIEHGSALFEVSEEVADNLRILQTQSRCYKNFRRYIILTDEEENVPDDSGVRF